MITILIIFVLLVSNFVFYSLYKKHLHLERVAKWYMRSLLQQNNNLRFELMENGNMTHQNIKYLSRNTLRIGKSYNFKESEELDKLISLYRCIRIFRTNIYY